MRILLADDQPQIRSALRLLLEQEPGLTVVDEASEVDDLMARVEASQPDVVLMDWELPDRRPLSPSLHPRRALISALRSLNDHLAVVALSGRPEASRSALAAGADAFVSKGDPPERLLSTLQALDGRESPL